MDASVSKNTSVTEATSGIAASVPQGLERQNSALLQSDSVKLGLDAVEVTGGCHCGGVRFHARLADGLRSARRCTCSYCRMRGAVAVTARVGDLELTQGADVLTVYKFNTGTARHYFCSRCGIYTHHQRRSNPEQLGINVACLDGASPFDFTALPVFDGARHPSDVGRAGSGLAGMLRFEPGPPLDGDLSPRQVAAP